MFTGLIAKVKELSEKPIPLGKAVVITGTLILLTVVIYGKPKTIIINNYNPGGCLF